MAEQTKDPQKNPDDQMAKKLMDELKAQGVDVEALQQSLTNSAETKPTEKPTEKTEPVKPEGQAEKPEETKRDVSADKPQPDKKQEETPPTESQASSPPETPVENQPEDGSTPPVEPAPEPKPASEEEIRQLAKRLDTQFRQQSNDVLFSITINKYLLLIIAILLALMVGGSLFMFLN